MNQMNQILRVFSTINRLFCEVRWLERNLRNSNSTVMIIVGAIILFCLFTASTGTNGGGFLPPGIHNVLENWGPLAIIALVAGLFLYRRSLSGPMSGSGGMNEVMFGGGDGGEQQQQSRQQAQSYPQHHYHYNQAAPPQAVPTCDNESSYQPTTNTASAVIAMPTSSAPQDPTKRQGTVHAESVHYV